jgi:hypothetical protein
MEGRSLPNYGLPPLPVLPCPEFKGPTPWSNWVMRGRVLAGEMPQHYTGAAKQFRLQWGNGQRVPLGILCAVKAVVCICNVTRCQKCPLILSFPHPRAGAYPASLDDYETERILTTLLELGVNTFVCLQAEFALHTPETAWRSGQGLRPYIKDAQRILIRARETQSTRIKQVGGCFLSRRACVMGPACGWLSFSGSWDGGKA